MKNSFSLTTYSKHVRDSIKAENIDYSNDLQALFDVTKIVDVIKCIIGSAFQEGLNLNDAQQELEKLHTNIEYAFGKGEISYVYDKVYEYARFFNSEYKSIREGIDINI